MNYNEYDLYKLIKSNYDFDLNEPRITEAPLSNFEYFKTLLKMDGYFEWDFSITFLDKCNSAYQITYKNIKFNILTNKVITKKNKTAFI